MNSVSKAPIKNSYDQFVDAGYTPRQAAILSGVVASWYMGNSVTAGRSRSTFNRYRSSIKSVLGIDIASSPNITVFIPREQDIKNIKLAPLVMPEWYKSV